MPGLFDRPPPPREPRVLTVGELTRRLKGAVEPVFQDVWVSGEVGNLRRQPSGHVYFGLKDADASVDAVLHDPPRFGIAGDLYSQAFYDGLARVLRRRGRLFHYTGAPNRLTSGRDVPNEVAKRLRHAGFTAELHGDGVLAVTRK